MLELASGALLAVAPVALAGPTSVLFTQAQTGSWTVPQGVTTLTVHAVGGSGGSTYNNQGGRGAHVTTHLAVSPGATRPTSASTATTSPLVWSSQAVVAAPTRALLERGGDAGAVGAGGVACYDYDSGAPGSLGQGGAGSTHIGMGGGGGGGGGYY